MRVEVHHAEGELARKVEDVVAEVRRLAAADGGDLAKADPHEHPRFAPALAPNVGHAQVLIERRVAAIRTDVQAFLVSLR